MLSSVKIKTIIDFGSVKGMENCITLAKSQGILLKMSDSPNILLIIFMFAFPLCLISTGKCYKIVLKCL